MSAPNSDPEHSCSPTGILLVDDSPTVRTLLGQLLQDAGFKVWLAIEGQQALQLFAKHREEIDLVVLDQDMPGMTGEQTLEAIHQVAPEAPICFLTGTVDEPMERQLRRQGVVQVFHKPMPPEEIVEALRRLAP